MRTPPKTSHPGPESLAESGLNVGSVLKPATVLHSSLRSLEYEGARLL
jgi:hypothetical protein